MATSSQISASDAKYEQEFQDSFESVLMSARSDLVIRPNLPQSALSCVVLDDENQAIWVDSQFDEWCGQGAIDPEICDEVRANGREQITQILDQHGRPLLLLYAPAAIGLVWPFHPTEEVRKIARNGGLVIGALSLAYLSDDLIRAARAMGMTNLEARLSAALVGHGSVPQAAAFCRVTYQTARKAISSAMKKVGAGRQAQLVRKLTEVMTNVAPPREVAERLLIDMFGLSYRDARLALLLGEGHGRDSAAKIAGLSKAVAKDGFTRIFETLTISSAAEIPRIVMESFASAFLFNDERTAINTKHDVHQPLRLYCRPDGSLIAVSDYGPKNGEPVLIMHSSLTTRHPFRKLVSALQADGFRPITMDRPGFGLTDDVVTEDGCDRDPFAVGANDFAHVCDAMKIAKMHIITRGGAFAALALAREYPSRIGRVVTINPDLLHNHCSKRQGNLGLVRKGFDRFPERIENIARWLGGQLTPERAGQITRLSLRHSAIDLAAFEDGIAMADYQRSVMVFATGKLSGFVREQRGYTLLSDVTGLSNGENWTLFIGESDPTHNIRDITAYWKSAVPNAKIKRPANAGRFIDLTHTDEIVAALRN